MAKSNNAGKFALGAVIAGIAGFAAGILTAPKSGKETRADIKNKAGEVKSSAEAQLHKTEAELKELVDKAQAQGDKLSGKAKAEMTAALSKAKVAQRKTAEVAKAVKAGKAKNPDLDAAVKQARDARKNLMKFIKG